MPIDKDIEQTQQNLQERAIEPSLFEEYIKWIDRPKTTTDTYIKALRRFYEYLQANGITRPVRDDVLAYCDMIRGMYKANTVALYIRSIQLFFKWTASNGIYPNIAENIHPPKVDRYSRKRDAFTPEAIQQIEKSILENTDCTDEQRKRMYAMVVLMLNAGLRTVEVSRANIGDIEVRDGQGWISIWGKGRDEADQRKPIAPQVMDAIRDYLDVRTDNFTKKSPLFVSTGNRSGGKRIATTTISTLIKRTLQRAGYDSEYLTAHSLRHTTGTAVQTITQDLYATQKYMRHADPGTTEIYLHMKDDEKESVTANELYDYFHTSPSENDQN